MPRDFSDEKRTAADASADGTQRGEAAVRVLHLSLRDYLATHAPIHDARALGGWIDATQRDAIYRAAAEHAYRFADAMLTARSQP